MEIPSREKVKKFFLIFLIAYIAVATLLIIVTSGRRFYEPLLEARITWLVPLILNALVFTSLDALRLKLISRSFGRTISFYDALDIILSGILLAIITPFGVGGLPYQIWILKRYGYTVSQCIAIILARGFVIFVPYMVALPFVYKHVHVGFSKAVFYYVLLVVLVVFLTFLLKKDYREKLLSIKLKYLLLGILVSFPAQLAYMSNLYMILKAMNLNADYFQSISIQLIVQLSTYFSPSPGGLGFAELVSSLVLKDYVSKQTLGYVVLLWRFFTSYAFAIVGFFFILRRLSRA